MANDDALGPVKLEFMFLSPYSWPNPVHWDTWDDHQSSLLAKIEDFVNSRPLLFGSYTKVGAQVMSNGFGTVREFDNHRHTANVIAVFFFRSPKPPFEPKDGEVWVLDDENELLEPEVWFCCNGLLINKKGIAVDPGTISDRDRFRRVLPRPIREQPDD